MFWQALIMESEERQEGRRSADCTFYEITIASVDQPKLLCRLSESLVSLSGHTHCSDWPPPRVSYLI